MDFNECQTLISAARNSWGNTSPEVLKDINKANEEFSDKVKNRFKGK